MKELNYDELTMDNYKEKVFLGELERIAEVLGIEGEVGVDYGTNHLIDKIKVLQLDAARWNCFVQNQNNS